MDNFPPNSHQQPNPSSSSSMNHVSQQAQHQTQHHVNGNAGNNTHNNNTNQNNSNITANNLALMAQQQVQQHQQPAVSSQPQHIQPQQQQYRLSAAGQSGSLDGSSNSSSRMSYGAVGSSKLGSNDTNTQAALLAQQQQQRQTQQQQQQRSGQHQQQQLTLQQRQALQQQLQQQQGRGQSGSWGVPNPLGASASTTQQQQQQPSSSSSLVSQYQQQQQNIASRGGVPVPALALQQAQQTYQQQQQQQQHLRNPNVGYGLSGSQLQQSQQPQQQQPYQQPLNQQKQGQHHQQQQQPMNPQQQNQQNLYQLQQQQQKLQQQQQKLQELQQRQNQLKQQQQQIQYQNQQQQQQHGNQYIAPQQQQPEPRPFQQTQLYQQQVQQQQPQQQQPLQYQRYQQQQQQNPQGQNQQQQQQRQRQKVVLSPQAKSALAKAIWSSIRSPIGEIDPTLLQAALATGLPKNAILNAARVARERERQKRQQRQEQRQQQMAQQQQQQQQLPGASSGNSQQQQLQQELLLQQQQQQKIKQRQQQLQLQQQKYRQQQQQQVAQDQSSQSPSPYVAQQSSQPQQQYSSSSRTGQQQQQQPYIQPSQQQQQLSSSQQPYNPSSQYQAQQQQQQQQQERIIVQPPRTSPVPAPSQQQKQRIVAPSGSRSIGKTLGSLAKAKQQAAAEQQALADKHARIKLEERSKWKRVHQGVFVVQKGKFSSPQNTVSAVLRTTCQKPVLLPSDSEESSIKNKLSDATLKQAAQIQQLFFQQKQQKAVEARAAAVLLDADKFKRIKMEPKKFGRALDRAARKARQVAAETLNKHYKEFGRAISSHQTEFFKFHRQKKADAAKIARAIRDNMEKEGKRREKDAVAAERARLAALKANDMDAYSRLLEETKNERLKFLMDKTEKHFAQISSTLTQERSSSEGAVVSGGASSYYASAHLRTEEVRQPSILVGGDLKEYQLSGLQWMISLYNNKLNGILADEMGLGKTIQAISLIAYLMEFKNNLGPFLVIVPLSTLSNWVNEFQKWCPSAHLICYKGIPAQRKEIYKEQVKNGNFNVLLTTYEYVIKDKASLRKITWQYAIVDEGHRMKNAGSKFAKTLSTQYETKYRILLTGTPLMNDLSELWSLLNFLLPTIFNSVDTFDQWFNKPFEQFGSSGNAGNEDESTALSNEERMFIIHRLHELLRPFMLRRVKSEVLDQLPEKVEKILRCEMSSWQKELYKQISKKAVADSGLLGSDPTEPQPVSRGLNNAVMQLRKVCNHPFLFAAQGYHINENLIRSSAKVELLDRMLPKLKAAGHRVLMFTQMTAVMTILEDYFSYRGYLSLRLDGSTPAEEREKRMYKFNAPDSPYFIFLLSTRAGGLGLNLTAANTVVIFDSDWNPMMDLQAQDRAHRIGQRSDVSVFRLITNSPVEEKILSRASEKLNMSELVVEAGKFDKSSVENDNSLERKRLMEVLLTDFDSNTNKNDPHDKTEDKASILTGSEDGSIDGDEDDDNIEDKEDDLNELISNNENDYQLYKSLDNSVPDPNAVDTSLFTSPEDVPDWIKYPSGQKEAPVQLLPGGIPDSGPRKRKDVVYDDGLTDKQFMRMMDKQFDSAAAAREGEKATFRGQKSPTGTAGAAAAAGVDSEITDWAFRKLTSCTKTVVALKDSNKRRICEVFMDKPSPEQFPDYYEIIHKPVAINDILRKVRGKLYANLREYMDDWRLMFANAKQFNGEDSWVVEDGKAIEKELDRVLKKNGFSEEAAAPRPPKPKKKFRIKLSLKGLKSKDGDDDQEDPDENISDDLDGGIAKPVKKKRKKNNPG